MLLLVIATFLAMKVESIYALMVSCWSSQLVVVFIPVIAAIYFPKASGNTIWCTMIVSTSVWLAYIFITGMGIPGTFTEKLAAPEFEFQLTNGAVFGFAAGVIAFIASFMGELISAKCNRSAEKEFKKNRKKQRKAERKAQNKLEMAD